MQEAHVPDRQDERRRLRHVSQAVCSVQARRPRQRQVQQRGAARGDQRRRVAPAVQRALQAAYDRACRQGVAAALAAAAAIGGGAAAIGSGSDAASGSCAASGSDLKSGTRLVECHRGDRHGGEGSPARGGQRHTCSGRASERGPRSGRYRAAGGRELRCCGGECSLGG